MRMDDSQVESSDTVALEWSSAARFHGSPADYRGVTVLALDDDKITGLRTYYDTAVFTRIPASAAAGDTP
jgi:ketosteroid isomerase-like protein